MLGGKVREICLKDLIEITQKTEKVSQEFYLKYSDQCEDDQQIHDLFQTFANEEAVFYQDNDKLIRNLPGNICIQANDQYVEKLKALDLGTYCGMDQRKKQAPNEALEGISRFKERVIELLQKIKESFGTSPHLDEILSKEKKHLGNLKALICARRSFQIMESNRSASDIPRAPSILGG